MKTVRLILGDQLNLNHSWFQAVDSNVLYLMAEMRQETDYARHHIQKVLGFFHAMRQFAAALEAKGHHILYYKISDAKNPQDLNELIHQTVEKQGGERFQYQLPDEYRLDEQLRQCAKALKIEVEAVDSEHFFTKRGTLADFFEGKKQLLMESFYRMMRKKHGILLHGEQPEGGKWNYDKQNRKKWKGDPAIPDFPNHRKDLSALQEEIREAGIETVGSVDAKNFPWPTSRAEGLELLEFFCRHLLPHFGDYQDAMHTGEPFLFHSRLSFALNSKMLSPLEVVETVEDYFHKHQDEIDISQVEGFIRQILGWREYMRGIYWREMPGYAERNFLENSNDLPNFYWTGDTQMNCLKNAIGQTLEHAYAHHIQRLMITGNFALLAQVDPDQVDAWYLGVYIDAIEWVEMTNTRGMSQYADGGLLATKPYVSSANYIGKMSNYCTDCRYNPKKKTGEDACPFNALYWNFLDAKRPQLGDNPRMGMMYSLLDKKDKDELDQIRQRAANIISKPDSF